MSSTSEPTHIATGGGPPDVRDDPDALLQATRRIDWRFLLDRPELGRVAYLGPASGELLRSASLFSDVLAAVDVEDFPAGTEAARAGAHDLVIAVEPRGDRLRSLRALLRPGGALYLEARNTVMRRRDGPNHAAGWTRALREADFERIEAFWIWPDFERCAEVVPLAEPEALLHALGRRQRDWRARAKAMGVTCAVRAGWMSRLAPCFALTAYRPGGEDREGV